MNTRYDLPEDFVRFNKGRAGAERMAQSLLGEMTPTEQAAVLEIADGNPTWTPEEIANHLNREHQMDIHPAGAAWLLRTSEA